MKILTLDKYRYACGAQYFEDGGRKFPQRDECKNRNAPKCRWVVHNNWIVSYEAEVYRFKEHLMWSYDKGKQSFHDRNRIEILM